MKKRFIVFLRLCLGWLIILFTYLLTYSVAFLIGWNVKHVLGILLIIFPYTVGALYYSAFCKGNSKTFYALSFLVPCIAEKISIYLTSAFIYDINPLYIGSVMQRIVDEGSKIRSGIDGILGYFPNAVSFFSWGYVLEGLLLSIILTIFLIKYQRIVTD
ncbi:hypothetical protein J22TS1_23650 [Siminovitchia terrae]|uniref:hypothetical protein n=1 Tax=Siminovitchia terrae TaxID=1914933 RepID=UPI001B06EE90|nr:hypothetical protein [Siminovitchia terrae]GIN91314.1 hypothetical protein J22TS1_23650 [Siminovitchia terrae]